MNLFLDAGPLGQLCNPSHKYRAFQEWLLRTVRLRRHQIFVSEVTIFEVRRELLLASLTASVERLDALSGLLIATTPDAMTWRSSGELWARLRREGAATASDAHVDFDVVLAAEALIYGAVVVTENVRHLARLVRVLTPAEARELR